MMLTAVIIAAFIVWFSSLWVAVLSLLSFIGGWKKLSRLYPLKSSDKNNTARKYSWSSIKMGFVNYRSCINISFTGTGIILETIKIFSIMHQPLFIPYNKITDLQKGKFFITFTSFILGEKKITIYGKAGEEIFSRLSSGSRSE